MQFRCILSLLIVWIATTAGHCTSHYVTVCFEGGQFGQQMFIYAMVLGYAWEHSLTPLFSKEMIMSAPNGTLNYQYVFHRMFETAPMDLDTNGYYHPYCNSNDPPPYAGGNLCLHGSKTQPSYFDRHREKIRALFMPSEEVLKELREKYSELLEHPKTVGMHVRTYHPAYGMHLLLSDEYYQKAMDQFDEDHLFLIVSDRIDWCKEHFKNSNRKIVFIEGNHHILDFYLLSLCKNIVTSNSLFSWWAAYLKKELYAGKILAPSKWWPDSINNSRPADAIANRNFYPSHWTVIPVIADPVADWDLVKYHSTSIHEP